MSAAALRFADLPDRTAPLTPSTRTIAATTAADHFRDALEQIKQDYRLTPAEVASILVGEMQRHVRNDLAWERYSGNTAPLCNRYIKPATEDASVAEAEAFADCVTDSALHG